MRASLGALGLLITTFSQVVQAQQIHYFDKGLMTSVPQRYGREAIYTDQLAYQLYTHTLKTPAEGSVFGKSEQGDELKWQTITADSLHRLRGRFGFRSSSGGPAGPGINPGSMRGGLAGTGAYIYLSYHSPKEQVAILNIKGNSHVYVNEELHMGDAYSMGYMDVPVKLKKGLNTFYVRGTSIIASLTFPTKPILLQTQDLTLPQPIVGGANQSLQAGVVVINTSSNALTDLQLKSSFQGKEVLTNLPPIPALTTRKVPFTLDASGITSKGKTEGTLSLIRKGKSVDQATIALEAVAPGESYSNTFISSIDGSLQYYAVTPQSTTPTAQSALFLSVHGAGVEASGQARAYKAKDWGTLVAATNRRPRGFNWEDWGRLDALEVLTLAKTRFNPDPQRVYLTGHSMGGHGTWFLGATYPDKWAAIAPCAGYPTLKEYGSADGLIPASSEVPMEQMLLRSGNQSDVLKLVTNYKPLGVYVFHGDADRTVPVTYARQMRKALGGFHPDLSYYEYPGGSHWFGDHSVDWKPLFDFFKWHQRPADSTVHSIDFITSNPGVSASYYWAGIQQQIKPLEYSRIQLQRSEKAITGKTENVHLLKLALHAFGSNAKVSITLDSLPSLTVTTASAQDSIYLRREASSWTKVQAPSLQEKGPHRYGTFKDGFNHRMIFVYGTQGTTEENQWSVEKARFDAETWYYRGNGAVDVISDKEYALQKYANRGVVLYGNASTNGAWKALLADCPIQVDRNGIKAGTQNWNGDDLAAYFVWPLRGSAQASVSVITGTGIKGFKASSANQYFAGASGFPDYMIFSLDMLQSGSKGVKMAGLFDNNWKLMPEGSVLN
ncbi:prolyl oligopeptidase family serine peptidase [Siphonobacter sp. SORGH_AS_1065]|uniref:carboxylesterase family protein n=1 Tax=Siphonobacter sp. SORGH_AS_1065 TaxID=3041795 RepID=UPI002786A54C|nr:PHB depolymerase family esterase [Siphonobacter sp. SORGH_AS_1065]MDQ1089984.1 poly(3-hydroxybutyrate) depolymerase [Siphonobacter sp. SORGH_AS_1065]